MNDNQQKFADMVQQNKSTIYTVCYMFSKDQDEVNDLFQEVLIRLWQGFVLGLLIALYFYRKMQRSNDELINQINNLTAIKDSSLQEKFGEIQHE